MLAGDLFAVNFKFFFTVLSYRIQGVISIFFNL